jgi:hypothetical protein
MTALTTPSFQRRLLQTVEEAVASDLAEEKIRLGMGIVRELRASFARMRREFEDEVARGVEARSFVREYGPTLPAADEYLASLRRLLEVLSVAEGTPAESFVAELRLLEEENKSFRDRVAEVLCLASAPPPRVDWERLKQEADADFGAGRFTTFETPEGILKELAGGD